MEQAEDRRVRSLGAEGLQEGFREEVSPLFVLKACILKGRPGDRGRSLFSHLPPCLKSLTLVPTPPFLSMLLVFSSPP